MNRIALFFFILLSFGAKAQDLTQTIRGEVLDADTKAPLIGVNIVVVGSDPFKGTTTDLDGKFRLEGVPVGRRTLRISYIGYRERTMPDLPVSTGKEVVLSVDLQESVAQLNEVVVTAETDKRESINEMATVSARQFTVEETGRYAGSRNDVSRMAANYAGVSNANDSRNDIVIRGNSPTGLLWRLEGLDIPGPNHFSTVGSNGGPVSMLNYNVIANSDFLTGAFPSDYGNALSGAFDIRLRNGNNEQREYMFQIGALGTEAMIEGPFKSGYDGSYLFNYRFSTTSILTAMGIDFGYSGEADYQDLSFKTHLPTKKFGTFDLFGLAGNSIYKVDADQKGEDNFDENWTENTNDRYESGIAVAGLTHRMLLGKKSYIRTVIGWSGQQSIGQTDSVSTSDAALTPYFKSENVHQRYQAHSFIKTKLNAKNKLKNGIILEHTRFDINSDLFDSNLGELASYSKANGSTELLQAYSQWQHLFTDDLTLNLGVHYQHLFLNGSSAIEPRAGLQYAFGQGQSLSLAYGLHSQMQTLPSYFTSTETPNGIINTNRDLGFSRSHHMVLGYDRGLGEHSRLKVEAYYQSLFDIPVNQMSDPSSFSMINEGSSYILSNEDSLVNDGTGRNIGLEITLERYFNRGYYFLLTGSFFESEYRGSDGIWRNTAFNGNYVANALIGKEFTVGERSKFLIDVKTSVAGGRRFTPIDEATSQLAGNAVYLENEAFSQQHNDYFRADLKVTYRFERPKVAHEFFINIDNVFNTQNVFAQTYSQRTNQLENVYQLGMFPTFQYKLLF